MDLIKKMEEYAANNYVPIARKDNIKYLQDLIAEEKLYKVLELGSAIGYSAICLASSHDEVYIKTIERNKELFDLAVNNIKEAGLEKRIDIINDDIFNVEIEGKYDLIFIDAAKAQYVKFFEKVKDNLNEKGVIVSDNIDLLDLQRLTNSKKSKKLVEKMKMYKDYLFSLDDYVSEYINVGDGFVVTRKKS